MTAFLEPEQNHQAPAEKRISVYFYDHDGEYVFTVWDRLVANNLAFYVVKNKKGVATFNIQTNHYEEIYYA